MATPAPAEGTKKVTAGCCKCKALAGHPEKAILKKIGSLINDPELMQKPIDVAFRLFDKDRNGFIDIAEVKVVADKVCRTAGLSAAPSPAVDMIFEKVAGTDGKLDRAEFTEMLRRMFFLAEQHQREKLGVMPADSAAAAAAPTK